MTDFAKALGVALLAILVVALMPAWVLFTGASELRAMFAGWRDESHVGGDAGEASASMPLGQLGLHRVDVRA